MYLILKMVKFIQFLTRKKQVFDKTVPREQQLLFELAIKLW
jgi:hypothetical protein